MPIQTININNAYFVDKKRNTVIEGDFTKILYSTEDFVMTGLFIYCPFVSGMRHRPPPPGFSVPHQTLHQYYNMEIIRRLCEIEMELLANYCTAYAPYKTPVYCLQNYMNSIPLRGTFVPTTLKISGVWENKINVGITLKVGKPPNALRHPLGA